MKVVVIGNGILGLTSALRLVTKDPEIRICIIGPESHRGCASLAAAAMLNSFCEVDSGTLTNPIEKQKFLFNRAAVPLWPEFLEIIGQESGQPVNHGFGTYVIDNHTTDQLEDENFFAIVNALRTFSEPFEFVEPREIPKYNPAPQARAARALYIPGEGYVNPVMLISSLKAILRRNSRVEFVDQNCQRLNVGGEKIISVELENGEEISADSFVLSPGANFSKLMEQSDLSLKTPRIFYGVGCSLLIKTAENTLERCVRTPNRGKACGIYAAPFDAEHIVVGASNFISPVPEDYVRLTSAHTLLDAAIEQINTLYYRSQLVKVNVGWRPTSADTVPLIGKTSISNLVVATGTKRDGLHCSPLISNIIADLVLTGRSEHEISLFTPERKLIRVWSREEAISTYVKHTINAAYQHGFKSAKNRMVEDLARYYADDLSRVHDKVGAVDWGIPIEMINMYRYGHIE